MGGQVLGGGVVALVAVLLWLVYLLPSWHSRHQYDAAERNAVRLNQALRVLAETSETPTEVRLELNARTALAQQRLARRTQNERGLADLELARQELAAARALPAARQARARRRARLITTIVGLAALAGAVWGGWQVVTTGSQVVLWSAVALAVVCGILLNRMSRVNARAIARETETETEVAPRRAVTVQDLALGVERDVAWTPRELPRPLTASAGSRAAAVLDQAAAREALRLAAQEERMREREAELQPASIDRARQAREEAESERFRQMGHVDDAEIEAHVRQLLQRRAASA
ncbi:large exoprotein [uncultured Microbacterium sp.]|uniref:large exoprotein n=1 Tax=uncultured Microbacterium sp. TaxID=191216 RepID=UPI0035CB6016